jgi:hypothetical protein
MNVAQLIEVLQTVEDKSKDMYLEYDGGCWRPIRCVYVSNSGKNVIVCEDDKESYGRHNPNYDNMTDEEYIQFQKNEIKDSDLHYRELCLRHNYPYDSKREKTDEQIAVEAERRLKIRNRIKEDRKNEDCLFVQDLL